MDAWVVAGGAVLVGLVATLAALVAGRDRPEEPATAAAPVGLPDPEDVADPALPVVWRGYAPADTDAHLARVVAAYAALHAAADDQARARAHHALGGTVADPEPQPGADREPRARPDPGPDGVS